MPEPGTIEVGTDGGAGESDTVLQEAVEIIEVSLRMQPPIAIDVSMSEGDE